MGGGYNVESKSAEQTECSLQLCGAKEGGMGKET